MYRNANVWVNVKAILKNYLQEIYFVLFKNFFKWDGSGHWLVRMEWRPAGWSVCLPVLIFPCTIKSRSSLLHRLTQVVPEKGRKKFVVVVFKKIFRSMRCTYQWWYDYVTTICSIGHRLFCEPRTVSSLLENFSVDCCLLILLKVNKQT